MTAYTTGTRNMGLHRSCCESVKTLHEYAVRKRNRLPHRYCCTLALKPACGLFSLQTRDRNARGTGTVAGQSMRATRVMAACQQTSQPIRRCEPIGLYLNRGPPFLIHCNRPGDLAVPGATAPNWRQKQDEISTQSAFSRRDRRRRHLI